MESKYSQIYNHLYEAILSGKYMPGDILPTEKDMVKQYGVSRITIQRALQMLVDLGYIERIAGKGTFVKANSSVLVQKNVAVIVPINNPEMTMVVSGIQQALEHTNYTAKIYFSNEKGISDCELIASIVEEGIEGIILYPRSRTKNAAFYREIVKKVPLIFIDKCVDGVVTDSVMPNNFEGAYEMVNYLVQEMGHKKIAYVDWGREDLTVIERKRGYMHALADNDIRIDESIILSANPGVGSVKEELGKVIKTFLSSPEGKDVTAFFFYTDEVALNGSYYINQMNKRIPDDISICGFDNSYLGRSMMPSLTTVAQDFSEIGLEAARLLIDRISNKRRLHSVVYVDTSLKKRDSVKNLNEV